MQRTAPSVAGVCRLSKSEFVAVEIVRARNPVSRCRCEPKGPGRRVCGDQNRQRQTAVAEEDGMAEDRMKYRKN